jgi:hypothetical protein
LAGSLLRCVDPWARAVIFSTEHSSCTAIPCSSIMHAAKETGRPHIQHVSAAFELDGTGCLQSFLRISALKHREGELEIYLTRPAVCPPAHSAKM